MGSGVANQETLQPTLLSVDFWHQDQGCLGPKADPCIHAEAGNQLIGGISMGVLQV